MTVRGLLFMATMASAAMLNVHRNLEDEREVPFAEYSPEESLSARARRVSDVCLKYKDRQRPEFVQVNFEFRKLDAEPEGSFKWDFLDPKLQVCVPGDKVLSEWWRDLTTVLEKEFGQKSTHKKAVSWEKEARGRYKAIVVQNPLVRLVNVFDSLSEEIARALTSDNKLSFKEFFRLIISDDEFTGTPESLKALRKLTGPYFNDCPVCHPDLLPTFVLKADSEHFTEDLEHIAEEFGFDDVEMDKPAVPSEDRIRELYSEVGAAHIAEVVDKLYIDFDMFGYSPERFYGFVRN